MLHLYILCAALPRRAAIFASVGALSAALFAHVSPAGGADRPNIVLIMSDDAGYNEFGFTNQLTGYPTTYAVTPRLDQLASQSVVMRQGYVAAPLCAGSRAGLLLGHYQQRERFENNLQNVITNPYGLPGNVPILPDHLKALGYTTGLIGKWHQGFVDGVNRPQDKGFDEFFGFLGGGRNYFFGGNDPAAAMRRGDTIIEADYPVNSANAYVPNVLGQEAVSFINNHAQDANPFFLMLTFTNPHTPFVSGPLNNGTLPVDYNHPQVATIPDPTQRTIAALNLAMDRNIGSVVDALAANGIDNNTIVVFLNDNGGPAYNIFQPDFPHGNNEPFRGFKGHTMEGGIRVPFFIKAPGVAPGVFNPAMTAYDLMPTLVAAAGGDPNSLNSSGVDLMPYLTGAATGSPHEWLFWRDRTFWAVRKGDWKLGRLIEPLFPWPQLFNLAVTEREHPDTDQMANQPALAAELMREFTKWEATLAKPAFIFERDDRNHFDHFVFRNDLSAVTTWSTTNAWRQAGTTNNKTFLVDDAYANAILEFTTRNDADYTATNDMARMTGLTFMLNQLRLTGNFAGAVNRTATINSGPLSQAVNGRITSLVSAGDLLFVKNLTGQTPRLQLDATSSTSAGFKFQVTHNLELMDNLEISGNGTQEFVFSGAIRDFHEPRNVTKTGTSRVTLSGASTFRGELAIQGGEVRLLGGGASLNGLSAITIGPAGSLRLDQGSITAPLLDNSSGGQFAFNGGRLAVVDVLGSLTNNGGVFAPGASPALSSIDGNFTQASGKLEIEIGGTTAGAGFDRVLVNGTATLGGTLEVKTINGFVPAYGQKFEFLSATGVQGSFNSYMLPALAGSETWSLQNDGQNVALIVGLPGDYNGNGKVDAADYVVWRNRKGKPTTVGGPGDGNRDGQVTLLDYQIWKTNYGAFRIPPVAGASFPGDLSNVPEPATALLFLAAFVCGWPRRRR